MVTLAGELGRIIFGVVAAELVRAALQRSGKKPLYGAVTNNKQSKIGGIMPGGYELVGHDDDYDDDLGSIGAELIGLEDEDLLEALSVSGDDYEDDDIISGAGDSEIVGRDRRRRGGRRMSRKAAELRKLIQRNAGAVVNRGLNRRRRYPLGFVPTAIAAGLQDSIPASPQNLFRPERLVLPSDIAFDLGVRDIKVGNQSQLAQSVEVPGALFSEVAINTGVTFDTAEVGNQISVDVINNSGASVTFSAGIVGTLAK